MMQAPVPPPPPGLDPNFVFKELMPIIAFVVVVVVGTVVLRALFRTPLGEALAERIRTRGRGGGARAVIPSAWPHWKHKWRSSRGRSPSSPSA